MNFSLVLHHGWRSVLAYWIRGAAGEPPGIYDRCTYDLNINTYTKRIDSKTSSLIFI